MSREYTNNTPVLRTLTQNSATPTTIVRRQCRQVETIAHKLREEIANQKTVNDDLTYQIDALRHDVEKKNRELAKQKETISLLRNENYNSVEKQVYETLKQDHDNLDSELKRLKSHVHNLESMKKDYETELQSFKDEMTKLTVELESSNKRTAEMDVVRAERDALVDQCHRFQDKLRVSEQLRHQEVETLQAAYEEKIQCLQEQIDELTENELSMSGEHIPQYEPESVPESLNIVNEIMYNELADNVETLKGQYEEQIRELRDALSQKDDHINELNERFSSLQSEITKLTVELESSNMRTAEMGVVEAERDALVDQCNQFQDKLRSSEQLRHQEVETLQAAHEEKILSLHETFKSEYEEPIRELRDALSQKDDHIIELNERFSSLQSEITKLTVELESSNMRTAEMGVVEAERDALVDKCRQFEDKLQVSEKLRRQEAESLHAASEKKVQQHEAELQAARQELHTFADAMQAKICVDEKMLAEMSAQLTKQIAHCKDVHQAELLRLTAETKSIEHCLATKLEAELRDLWDLLIEKDVTIAKLQEKIQSQDAGLTDLQAFSSKVENMTKSRNEKISRLEDEIREQRRSCTELHTSEIQRLNDDLKRFNEMVGKKEKEQQRMREDLQIMEQSFEMERAQKKRYQRECMELEKKLDSLKSSNAGNNTYIMPTINIQSAASGHDAAAAAAIVNSLSQSHAGNSTFDMGKSRRLLPGTSFFVADEPSEVMNSSFVSTSEDPYERFSTLQERNRLQPPHLKSCYAAEHQEVAIPENQIRGIPDRQILAAMASSGANQTFSITDTTSHTRTYQ